MKPAPLKDKVYLKNKDIPITWVDYFKKEDVVALKLWLESKSTAFIGTKTDNIIVIKQSDWKEGWSDVSSFPEKVKD